MIIEVFEETTLTLSAWVSRGAGARATAKFVFDQKGGSANVEAGDLKLGEKTGKGSDAKKKVSTKVTVPKCTDEEDFYTFSYTVTVGDTPLPGRSFKVWRRFTKFKAVDESGDPLEDVPVAYNHEEGKVYLTDQNGEVPLPMKAMVSPTLTVPSPCEVLEWVKDVGAVREAKVLVKEYQVSLGSFDAAKTTEDKPHKQYVNLDVDSKQLHHGSKIKVHVRGRVDSEDMPGVEGDTVYIKVEFDKDNSKRNDPAPALIAGGKTIKPAKGVAEGTAKYDGKGNAEFEVELGQAGGDKTKITAGITKACEDATLYVENWRKLWYQLTVPKGAAPPSFAALEDCLNEVFVEYQQEGDLVEIEETDNAPKGLSWIDGSWVGMIEKKILTVGSYNRDYYHSKFVGKNRPRSIHVMCCHKQYDHMRKRSTLLKQVVTANDEITWTDKSKRIGRTFEIKGMFPQALHDGKNPFRSGIWRAYENGHCVGSGTLSVRHAHPEVGKLTMRLPAKVSEFLETNPEKNSVQLDLEYRLAAGPYAGEASKHKQLIVIGGSERNINNAVGHELGHSLRQVPHPTGKKKPPGLESVEHGREYVGNNHKGGHCANGMSDANYADGAGKKSTAYHKNFRGKLECTCIMFGEVNPNGTNKFCERCQPFVKGQALLTVEG